VEGRGGDVGRVGVEGRGCQLQVGSVRGTGGVLTGCNACVRLVGCTVGCMRGALLSSIRNANHNVWVMHALIPSLPCLTMPWCATHPITRWSPTLS
jgi:hypothetical protein